MKFKFKRNDTVVYKTLDKRHHIGKVDSKLRIGNHYTVYKTAVSIQGNPVIILAELPAWNYLEECFDLVKPWKLKVRLP